MGYLLTELDMDTGLAIGAICLTFGLGLICMLTIFCRSFFANQIEEPTEINTTDDNTIQETLLLQ
jgi:hypothetical protein